MEAAQSENEKLEHSLNAAETAIAPLKEDSKASKSSSSGLHASGAAKEKKASKDPGSRHRAIVARQEDRCL